MTTDQFTQPCVASTAVPTEPEALFARRFFGLFASKNRSRVFFLLRSRGGTLCVSEIAQQMHLGLSTISRHLRLLREAGLVEAKAHGSYRYYHIRWQELEQAYLRLVQADTEARSQEEGGLSC